MTIPYCQNFSKNNYNTVKKICFATKDTTLCLPTTIICYKKYNKKTVSSQTHDLQKDSPEASASGLYKPIINLNYEILYDDIYITSVIQLYYL